MKFVFVTRHFGALRSYDEALVQLGAHGHHIHIVALQSGDPTGETLVQSLAARVANLSFAYAPWGTREARETARTRLRLAADYLRYLEPRFASTPRLIERAADRAPRVVLPLHRSARARRVVTGLLDRVERAAPLQPECVALLASLRPDVVFFSPLIGLGSAELDYLDAARALGLRTIFGVWSWDNLSSKARLRAMPDLVTVWNPTQAEEARDLHGVPADRIVVTGAQSFDQWFDRQPSRNRAAFCSAVGLPDDRPFLLWVCSALFKGSPSEAAFVREWIQAIRASSDPRLREIAILVRPHPARLGEWNDVPVDDLGAVSVWGANPVDVAAKTDYFESMYYSVAVAGLNTTAFLEAAVVGRPVYTVLLPQFYENQEGTLHFRYLLNVAGGLLHAQRNLADHVADLSAAVAAPVDAAARSVRFVDAFVRPLGRDVNATDRLVATVEGFASRPFAPADLSRPSRVWRTSYRVLHSVTRSGWGRRFIQDRIEHDENRRRDETVRTRRRQKRQTRWAQRRRRALQLLQSSDERRQVLTKILKGTR